MRAMKKITWGLATVGAVLLLLPLTAFAQAKPAPGANQAFLYELSENATLLNYLGHVLLPDPTGTSLTGLIDSQTGSTVIPDVVPATRNAVSELQGYASYPSPLCPANALVTNPKSDTCTVTATGANSVTLVNGSQPTGGAVWGTFDVVIQLDNSVDSPEWPLVTGAFYGTITFGQPGVPIGSANGFFVIGGQVSNARACIGASLTCLPFTAKFRQPFAVSEKGDHVKPRRGNDAFYLLDNGKLQRVKQDERAVGWPTVRFEVNF